MNYVNEAKFIAWYESVADQPWLSSTALLDDVFRQYTETRTAEYVIPAAKTVTGETERYPFRFESIGACGACTNYIFF